MLRSIVIALALAVGVAIPVLAEETNSNADARQSADRFMDAFNDASKNKDAAALARLFTEDAFIVTPGGTISGRAAIAKWREDGFKDFTAEPAKLDRVDVIGSDVRLRSGTWAGTFQSANGPVQVHGYWATTDVFDEGAWKIRMETFGMSPPADSK